MKKNRFPGILMLLLMYIVFNSCSEQEPLPENDLMLKLKSATAYQVNLTFRSRSGGNEIDLWNDYGNFSLETEFEGIAFDDDEYVSDLTYQISKAGNNFAEGWSIDVVNNVTKDGNSKGYQICRGGRYEIRAEASVMKNGELIHVFSDPILITANWPDYSTYIKDGQFQQKKEEAKAKSIAAVSQRMEYGFFIYLRINGGNRLEIGEMCRGDASSCGSEAHVNITGDEDNFNRNPTQPFKYILANFHTHPPLTECSYETKRIPGPSENWDKPGASNSLYTWLVLDYCEGLVNGELRGGHDKNAAMKIYYCGAPTRSNPE
ncbi:hypothetical protein [Sunxiuqinia indica]|uniref:hypothetical protein n=1 Tax=Sunxiuqinia indica TaxID=2692584 RepID=UPI001359D4DF|nr:hypothetical protein [Sunxiuqinia indica]